MRVWLIHLGELLQCDGPDVRLYRLGLLADVLVERGHEVVRWAPTFVHTSKQQRFDADTTVELSERHHIELIHARGYQRHIGPGRLRFQRQVAHRWEQRQKHLPAPHVILTSLPTPDICAAARRIGRQRDAPFVIDVRDLWPDALFGAVPRPLTWAAHLAALPMTASLHRSFRAATAVTGISTRYVEWGVAKAGRPASELDVAFAPGYAPPVAAPAEVERHAALWRARLTPSASVCLFLGTLSRQFDLSTVVAAARRLARDSPGQYEWIIGGDGPTAAALRAAAADLPNVHFPGWLDGPELTALLRVSSIGLAPYAANSTMSLPNKPFEYAWAGLPVVSSLVGELAALLAGKGFGRSYAAGDVAGLASHITAYHADPSLREREGAAGHELWKTEYDAAATYRRMADYLEQVAQSAHPDNRLTPTGIAP